MITDLVTTKLAYQSTQKKPLTHSIANYSSQNDFRFFCEITLSEVM